MTSDMAFECLLVSRDPQVVCTLSPLLDRLSIATKLCLSSSKAQIALKDGSADIVVIDWDDDDSASTLVRQIQASDAGRKQTVVAISTGERAVPGVHVLLKKPVTRDSIAEPLKHIYSRMLRDHRRHARYALMTPVIVTDSSNRLLPVTITDIGDGGVGLSSKETIAVGDVVSFRLCLPNARRAIYIEARVLWNRQYGRSGCEFVRIPPVDLDILADWLKQKCQIKKPQTGL